MYSAAPLPLKPTTMQPHAIASSGGRAKPSGNVADKNIAALAREFATSRCVAFLIGAKGTSEYSGYIERKVPRIAVVNQPLRGINATSRRLSRAGRNKAASVPDATTGASIPIDS